MLERLRPDVADSVSGRTSLQSIGGWCLPASEDDHCPCCGAEPFHYRPGYAIYAENFCPKCGYSERLRYS
jgi:hypothetical protein